MTAESTALDGKVHSHFVGKIDRLTVESTFRLQPTCHLGGPLLSGIKWVKRSAEEARERGSAARYIKLMPLITVTGVRPTAHAGLT